MNTLDHAVAWLGHALEPLALATASDAAVCSLLETLGWSVPVAPQCIRGLGEPLAALLGDLAALLSARAQVEAGTAPYASLAAPSLAVAGGLAASVAAVRVLPSLLRAELGAAWADLTAIDLEFERRLWAWLLDSDLRRRSAVFHAVLAAVGAVERSEMAADLDRHQPAFTLITLRPERLVAAVHLPTELLGELYGWGTGAIDEKRLFARVLALGVALGAPGTYRRPTVSLTDVLAPTAPSESAPPRAELWLPAIRNELAGVDLVVQTVPATALAPLEGVALSVVPYGDVAGGLELGEGLMLTFEASSAFSSGVAIVVRPQREPALHPRDNTSASASAIGTLAFTIRKAAGSNGDAAVELTTSGVGLRLHDLALTLGATAGGTTPPSVFAEIRVDRGDLVVESPANDALLASALPTGGVTVPLSLALRWSEEGLAFVGAGGLEVEGATVVALGPLRLTGTRVAVNLTNASVETGVSIAAEVRWGPAQLTMGWAGLRAEFTASPGNLGPVDLAVGWQRPSEIGLAIDASAARGGGSITLDNSAGRYTGRLTLDVLGVAVSAFGLLEAQRAKQSLAAIISATFPAISLPLGFTLDGIGGVIAIHRGIDTDALRASLRAPAGLGDIFFSSDPVAQVERVAADLAAYFPAAEGRHVIGPAAKFGWGTPTMVRGELAVLLELPAPARVVVLGTVSAKLPTVDQAIVDLNVDVLGEVDFAQKRVAVDASLRNSTIAGFPITGDMAFRMAWGSPPSFALAIGGFHSQFPTPPGFPELRRIQIPLGAGDDPRLDAQGFLALTSNTAQIGAQIDLYASAGPLNIKGWLGFETLLTFSPFQLQVDVWAGVALRRGTSTLASIHFDGHLSGPKPWRLDGKACLSLWFVDLCVPIHVSFGAGTAAVLPSRQIWPALHEALATPAAWASAVPPGLAAAVTAPASGEAPAPRLEPCATLTVTQKVVPLDRQITTFAHGRPDGIARFQVTGVRFGTTAVPAQELAPVTEWFAPAQFEEMSEADKLSRPGFEQMVGGVSIGAATIRAGAPLVRALDYDTVVIVDGQRQEPPRYRPTRDLQLEGTLAAASARPPLRATGPAAFAPPPGRSPRLRLVEETFVIASTDALAPRWDLAAAGTRGQVELALRAHLAAHPGDAGRLQVVPTFEVAA